MTSKWFWALLPRQECTGLTLNCSSDTTRRWCEPCMSGERARSWATSRGSGSGAPWPSSTTMPTTGARCISWISLAAGGRRTKRQFSVTDGAPIRTSSAHAAATCLCRDSFLGSVLHGGDAEHVGENAAPVGACPQGGHVVRTWEKKKKKDSQITVAGHAIRPNHEWSKKRFLILLFFKKIIRMAESLRLKEMLT